MAAEQKARSTYEYLIDLANDPDVIDVLRFLREREVVHFQRFGEALRTVQEKLAQRNYYMNTLGANANDTTTCPNTLGANDCGCKQPTNNSCKTCKG